MAFRRSVITIGLLVLGSVLNIHAQHSESFSGSFSGSWTPRKMPIPVPNDQLHLLLADLPPEVDWIVGVRVDEEKQGKLAVGEVRFSGPSAPPRVPIRHISEIVNWPMDRIKIRPGSIEVSGLSQLGGSLLVYIAVPSGTEVRIDGPNKPIAFAKVRDGLLVQNGVIIPEEVKGIPTLATRLIAPQRPKNTAELVKVRSQYFATPNVLASHLLAFRKPSYPTNVTASQHERMIKLSIKIDESGQVTEINRLQGEEAFLRSCEEAIREWKFRPFLVDGKPVSVTALVLFIFSESGVVSSPVFQELGK